jgi:hypothetical protein
MTFSLKEGSAKRRQTVRCILTYSMKTFDRHCQFVGICSALLDSYISMDIAFCLSLSLSDNSFDSLDTECRLDSIVFLPVLGYI